MVIEVFDRDECITAVCPCGTMAIVIDADGCTAEITRAGLLELIEHARTCTASHSINAARVGRLMAERYPRLP